jgi:hypothetical protein
MKTLRFTRGFARLALALGGALALAGTPVAAQVTSVDPDAAIDGDLQDEGDESGPSAPEAPVREAVPVGPEAAESDSEIDSWRDDYPASAEAVPAPEMAKPVTDEDFAQQVEDDTTYRQDDLIGAAGSVFGDGAREVAGLIERILKDQGEPNGYIVGREGGGAFIIGVRYGSGTLYHKVEGKRPVYWTGPSIGLDAGANAGSTFVLVYNLYDTQDLYTRFPAGEGQLYFVGGASASYLRKGDIVLIPIRVGAGLRAGINAGYLKLTEKAQWLPF